MSTAVAGDAATIAHVASIPDMPGRLTSMTTTWGESSAASRVVDDEHADGCRVTGRRAQIPLGHATTIVRGS